MCNLRRQAGGAVSAPSPRTPPLHREAESWERSRRQSHGSLILRVSQHPDPRWPDWRPPTAGKVSPHVQICSLLTAHRSRVLLPPGPPGCRQPQLSSVSSPIPVPRTTWHTTDALPRPWGQQAKMREPLTWCPHATPQQAPCSRPAPRARAGLSHAPRLTRLGEAGAGAEWRGWREPWGEKARLPASQAGAPEAPGTAPRTDALHRLRGALLPGSLSNTAAPDLPRLVTLTRGPGRLFSAPITRELSHWSGPRRVR